MKSFLRLSFMAIALTLFFNAFAVTETKAQGVLNEVLKRMEINRQSLQTLRANISMAKYNAQLGENDLTQGTVVYMPGKKEREMYIRIDWIKPVQEQLAVVKDAYTIYRPRLGQVIIGKIDKAQGSARANGALSFLNMSKEQLKANYTVKYLGREKVSSGDETVHLQLTPKNVNSYKSAELWVDKDGMPVQAKVIESNDDTTTILLSYLKKNTTINASDFTIKYPKNIKPTRV
ncbi:MAG: outer membrane lipoprotein carrier protein LolA [Acidobacteria bacterium]|nr:outer membrane lipoprotein carrier protein LolA [Acidobacteriota bacterium]MCA1637845.1 outer membrane lipoprotein carrier protein LolA [Acidobacteriota bacterium]